MKDLYSYTHYKSFLLDRMPTKGKIRGLRSKLAETLNCQLSYVSLVLTTEKHDFNLEHGQKICQFLDLSEQETDYFLLLLSEARAGTKDLKDYYKKKIQETINTQLEIKSRIKNHQELSKADQAIYYSDWYFTALHMILRRKNNLSPQELSTQLKLPINTIHNSLLFLEKAGIISKEKNGYTVNDIRIHLSEGANWLNVHHKNWRNKSIESLDRKQNQDLHYTMVTSISEKAATEIKQKILKMIQECEPVIRDAEDQVVYNLNLDFFKIY